MISVVVPSFNSAATLAATLLTAIEQDEVCFEIIVVDDGSTDDSLAIARAFEPSVRVLTGPNRGVSIARNQGIAESRGAWLVFLDSDDLLLNGTLRARLRVAEATGADVVMCNWEDIKEHDSGGIDHTARHVDFAALAQNAEIACATRIWAPTAAILYRRSIVEKTGGFRLDLPVIQDARFLFDAAWHGARFAHAPHVGARYRILPKSLSRRNSGDFWRDVLTNGAQIEGLWRGRGPLSSEQREALASIYDNAARGLFASVAEEYFEAVQRHRGLGTLLPLHPRLTAPLARAVGLHRARSILSLLH